MNLKFGTDKKLKSRKRIERLFAEGKRLSKYFLTAVYGFDTTATGYKVGVSVPKRKIRKAHERNLLKRRIREAFRRNQYRLENRFSTEIMFVYIASEPLSYNTIEKSMLFLIDCLNSASADCISA